MANIHGVIWLRLGKSANKTIFVDRVFISCGESSDLVVERSIVCDNSSKGLI